jgi:hypothetical protein
MAGGLLAEKRGAEKRVWWLMLVVDELDGDLSSCDVGPKQCFDVEVVDEFLGVLGEGCLLSCCF